MKLIAALSILALCSCGTGTTVTFGKNGIEITPPPGQIVIPTGK